MLQRIFTCEHNFRCVQCPQTSHWPQFIKLISAIWESSFLSFVANATHRLIISKIVIWTVIRPDVFECIRCSWFGLGKTVAVAFQFDLLVVLPLLFGFLECVSFSYFCFLFSSDSKIWIPVFLRIFPVRNDCTNFLFILNNFFLIVLLEKNPQHNN